jgi:2,5-dihydroxypyridine 5,6-dioxygenase
LGSFPVLTSYESKIGNHPYRTDFELINREGSKTRWLKIGLSLDRQKKYFPTPERTDLTLKGAEILHTTREIRVTGSAGSDFRVRKEGRPGHAQYGIADVPGRYDNFGFGSVACSPLEFTAEGVVVLEPGDTFQSYPNTVPSRDMAVAESVRITFEGGYVTKVEGGQSAERFETLLKSYNNKESSGISHIGFGTQEKTEIGHLGFYSSNGMGVISFSLGANYGHGLGGESLKYSGFGATTRLAPSHTNFTVFGQDFSCDGQKLVEKGRLLLA